MKKFKTIGLFAKHASPEITDTCHQLATFLTTHKKTFFIEEKTAARLKLNFPIADLHTLQKKCDLFIVVGGDGSLLNTAPFAVECDTPILGINRGKLGFLTDIKPDEITEKLAHILDGHSVEDTRFLLKTTVTNRADFGVALNEVVVGTCNTASMLEFEVYVDQQFMCSHRADGMIVATPTGSTAYSLSGGGPILHPSLNAIVMLPMFSHSLTQRPIVVHGDSEIKFVISRQSSKKPQLSCDSHHYFDVQPGDEIIIKKLKKPLRLIHPPDYDYFDALRSKLHWGKQTIQK